MEAASSSATLVRIYQTTRHHYRMIVILIYTATSIEISYSSGLQIKAFSQITT
jgi:hypothetical protein